MGTVKEDWEMPLDLLYKQMACNVQESTDQKIRKIYFLFAYWLIALAMGAVFVTLIIRWEQSETEMPYWFQRSGSIISLLAVVFEIVFLTRLNRLIKLTFWAQLVPDIYIERKCKWILNLTIVVTFGIVALGTLIWGYGDLFYALMKEA
jgi:hypothetical protein